MKLKLNKKMINKNMILKNKRILIIKNIISYKINLLNLKISCQRKFNLKKPVWKK